MMTRKHNVEDIRKILEEMDNKGLSYFSKLPIKISKRMTRSLGSAVSKVQWDIRTREIVKVTPLEFKFSQYLLDAQLTDQQFKDIIVHEWTHLYANNKYQDDCGHDFRYKAECKKLGYDYVGGMYCSKEIGRAFTSAIRNAKMQVK